MPFRSRFVDKFPNPLEVDSTFAALAVEYSDFCRLEQLPHLSHSCATRPNLYEISSVSRCQLFLYLIVLELFTSFHRSHHKPA